MKDKPSKDIIAAQMQVVAEAVAPWRSQVLFSLFDIGVFEHLSKHAADGETLSKQLEVPGNSLKRLLDCGVSLGFLQKDGTVYQNAAITDQTLVGGRSGYMGNWLLLAARWYRSFGRLTEAIRKDHAVEDVNFMEDPQYRELFVKGMIDYARYRGQDILNHLDLSRCTRLLDIGCGPAVYSVMFCEAYPDLKCVCLDLPHAIEIAKNYVSGSEVANRITLTAVDYRKIASFGEPCDVIFLSHILHQEDKSSCLDLLNRCSAALNPDGFLVVQAMFPDTKAIPSSFAALHDLLALLIFPGGGNHRQADVIEWMEAAGCIDIRHHPMSLLNINSLVIGRKPPPTGDCHA
ncbi:MAG: methyltransferase domain-containing protein [bacterium]|nr:methyltransferase domain-containing protein [bacterium]